MSTVRFFNLSEPVVPLYRHVGAALTDRGDRVEFVISRSSYRGGDDHLAHAVPQGTVIVTPGPRKQFSNKLGRVLAMGFYWIGAAMVILTKGKPDVNVFLTQPPCFVGLAVRLAHLRRQACIVVVMDIHPDELVSFGAFPSGSMVDKFFTWLMNGAWRRADRIVVIGRCMRDRIAAKGVDADRILVIPNWVDDATIVPVDRDSNRVREALGWGEDFVVMYGGNVGYAQQYDTLIAAANVIDQSEGVRLAVVGDGSRARHVQEGMEDSVSGEYHPLLHENYPLGEVLSAADVHFISLRDDCTGLGVPSKTYAALAAGRPILFEGSPECEVYLEVMEDELGAAVKSGDVDGLVASIRRLAADRTDWQRTCKQARAVLEDKYSSAHGVQRYVDALTPWL